MKKHLFFLTVAILLMPISSQALDDIAHSNGGSASLKLKNSGLGQNDDRSPGPQQLICQYSSESITINFPADVELITITIGESYAPIWIGDVTASEPTATFPPVSGTQLVTCTTEAGQIYSDYLSF